MLFTSFDFLIFLPVVFSIYWMLGKDNLRLQNIILFFASYIFYGWWDFRFCGLLLASTLLDFFTGIQIARATGSSKKRWFLLSLVVNLGILGVFKYYNFFADSAMYLLQSGGFSVHFNLLNIVLPVGISFYTFHGISYVYDIYKDKIRPNTDFWQYSVFVSFFPLLVAGPIERATHLLPQLKEKRKFDYPMAVLGLRQMLWGFFKKMVIADNCSSLVELTFSNPQNYTGGTLILGALLFSIQIYCDFSGYSDIALGTAKLFGINLLRNFNFPYFSRDIAEFWRKWHISLTSWFRDYLYIPLGGSKEGLVKSIRNTFIVFIVSGFWHGANWTFIWWGILHASYFMVLLLSGKNRQHLDSVAEGKLFPSLREFGAMSLTFALVTVAWIIFRSDTIGKAIIYYRRIITGSVLDIQYNIQVVRQSIYLFALIVPFFILEWMGRHRHFAIENMASGSHYLVRWTFYASLLFILGMFLSPKGTQFIYFQF